MSETLVARQGRLFTTCRDALHAIAGVEYVDVRWAAKGRMAPSVTMSFKGWSPSLHGITVEATEAMPQGIEDEDALTGHFLERFAPVIERQRMRARDAKALGASAPLPNGQVDHLMIDSAMPPIAREHGTDMMGTIRNTIGTLHSRNDTHHGGQLIRRPGMIIGESHQADRTLRYVAPSIKMRIDRRRRGVVHTGPWVLVTTDHLPETTLAAAIGRRIGDVVSIHPSLDERIIRQAENRRSPEQQIALGIDQHLEPVAAIAA